MSNNSTNQNSNQPNTNTVNQIPMPGSEFGIYKPQNNPTPSMEGFNPSNRVAVYDSVDGK